MDPKRKISKLIEDKHNIFTKVSDKVWEFAETRFATKNSADAFLSVLNEEGFLIEKSIANMENSFVATFGKGDPVIGILAEYDALGNMSQVADLKEQKPIVEGENGHGCGHNLLGAGALAGAVGIKDYMKENNIEGTIKLFGCPAEESGYGKSFMTRDGVFSDLDIALTWHPMDYSEAWGMSSLAVFQSYFNFKGRSAHAASSPEQGRSALDAAELMNIGVQFLREHIVDSARIHYAFIDAGGESANVVQPTASLYYFVRARDLDTARDVFERVKKVAQGAAMMTETELEIVFDAAAANYIPNQTLTKAMYNNMIEYGMIDITKEDLEYGEGYLNSVPDSVKENLYKRVCSAFPEKSEEEKKAMANSPYLKETFPLAFSDNTLGSTDVGDVSWVVPTAQVFLGTEPQGTPPHSWQWVANGKSCVAHKGILAAGKIIATTALDILTKPELLKEVKEEYAKTFANKKYKCGIPKDISPK